MSISDKLYGGESSGFRILQDTYFQYAHEVNTNRSIPHVFDGLKTVQRRILFKFAQNIKKPGEEFHKSNECVGWVIPIHPHSEDAVYLAAVRMTKSKGWWDPAPLLGDGAFGVASSSKSPAASRYTSMGLSQWAKDWLEDIEYADMKATEDGNGLEPAFLPARYPTILVPGHEGLGVGISTDIPPFNFWDILDLTKTYVEHGNFQDKVIRPDFPTGGSIFVSEADAIKMMESGKGTYKSRAKFHTDKDAKVIVISEVPYGSTVQALEEAVKKMKWGKNWNTAKTRNLEDHYPDILSVQDNQGFGQEGLKIYCRKSADLGQVRADLFRAGVLQVQGTTNMVWYDGTSIQEAGVYSMIEAWLRSRQKIVRKKYTSLIESVNVELGRLEYFIRLISNVEWRDAYLDAVVNKNKHSANKYLESIFPEIEADQVDWIYERRASSFNKSNAYQTRYDNLHVELENYKAILGDIKGFILSDLKAVEAEHSGHHARRSVITTTDVQIRKGSDANLPPDRDNESMVYYHLASNGLVSKSVERPWMEGKVVCAKANAVLVGFDVHGRIVRLFGEDLATGSSMYLYKYLGTDVLPNHEIAYLVALDGKKYTFVYNDGYVSYFDTSKLATSRKFKVIQAGVPAEVLTNLIEIIPGKPEKVAWVFDNEEGKTFIGVADLDEIREPKNITSRVRAVDLDDHYAEYLTWTNDVGEYVEGNILKKNPDWSMGTELKVGRLYELPDSLVKRWLGVLRTPSIAR